MTTEDRIRDMLGKNRVFLFMKATPQQPQCGFSMRAVSILRALDVPYATFDILTDPEVRQGVKDFANWQTFPQLWIDQQLVGGSDIMMVMWEQGELEDMVKDIPKSA